MLTLLVACLFHSRSSWTLQLLGIAHGKVVDGSISNVQAISSQSWTCPASSWNPKLNITDVFTPKPSKNPENPEIYFSADEVENNQELSIITATGNVEIIRNDLTVKADKIIYNQKEDTVTAVGDVVLVEQDGNVVFSDYAELTDKMSKGEMKNIKVILADKSRIAASTFRRGDKDKV